MWAFILAFLVFAGFTFWAFVVGTAEGMADAPRYSNTPLVIFIFGALLAIVIACTHWLTFLGW
jgi:hypothetical protein